MLRRTLLILALAAAAVAAHAVTPGWLPASPQKIPRWRGFNLTEKFMLHPGDSAFHEQDFQLISQFGFNFVRLPMDYRFWIRNGDWRQFDESALKDIDQGRCMGRRIRHPRLPQFPPRTRLHRRTTRGEPCALDRHGAQEVCAMHWARFARHFKGIPNERLSFNLFNEPKDIDPALYVAVCKKMADAIRAEDPDRLIIADGLAWGTKPGAGTACAECRGSHARLLADGCDALHGRMDWRERTRAPTRVAAPGDMWPHAGTVEIELGLCGPIVIDGTFPANASLRLRVAIVSNRAAAHRGSGWTAGVGTPVRERLRAGRMETHGLQHALEDLPERIRPRLRAAHLHRRIGAAHRRAGRRLG